MSISVVLLAYKEAENLKILLPQIKKEVESCEREYEILVIDTMEPLDDTRAVCRDYGGSECFYFNQEEPYFGGAFRTGIKYARFEKFLILDSDGSHNPRSIPDVYNTFIDGADVVIGSRYVKGGKTVSSMSSRVMSYLLNAVFRMCLGIKAKDISTDFRMYYTEQLKKLTLICDNYDVLQEVLLKLRINKPTLVIKETPIKFEQRYLGESKRQLIPFIISYIKTLFLLMAIRLSEPQEMVVFRQFAFYCIFGVIAAGLDFTVFTFVNSLDAVRNPVIGNIAGATFGFFFTFLMNTYVNFKKSTRLFRRFSTYLLIVLFGMLLSSAVIGLLQDFVNLYALKVCCLVTISCLQFILNKSFTFRK